MTRCPTSPSPWPSAWPSMSSVASSCSWPTDVTDVVGAVTAASWWTPWTVTQCAQQKHSEKLHREEVLKFCEFFNKCSFYQIVSFHFTNSIFYIHQSFMLLHPVCLMRSRDLPVQAFRTSSHTNAKKPAISVNSTERDSWKKMPEIKIMFTLYTVLSCTQLVSVLDASMPESSIQIHTQQ